MPANIIKPRNLENPGLNIVIKFPIAKLRFKTGCPVSKVVLKELPDLLNPNPDAHPPNKI